MLDVRAYLAHAFPSAALDPLARQAAISAYAQALALTPPFAPAWLRRGNALITLGNWPEALQAFEEAARQAPQASAVWVGMGSVMLATGHYVPALSRFHHAVLCDAHDPMAWLGKGLALLYLQGWREAQKCFEHLIRLDPQHSLAWLGVGYALFQQDLIAEATVAFACANQFAETRRPALEVLASLAPPSQPLRSFPPDGAHESPAP